jgi:hypothetical protein
VFNLKWSVLASALGFVLSLLVSLVSGAGFYSLLRAVIFGVVFFVISSLLYWMIKRFLPELLTPEDEGMPSLDLGSQVDIALDDDGSALAAALRQGAKDGVPEAALGVEGLERLIAGDSPAAGFDLRESGGSGGREVSTGTALDQDRETDYTNKDTEERGSPAGGFDLFGYSSPGIPPGGGSGGPFPVKSAGPVPAALPAEGIDTLDILPGSESLSRAFLPSFGDDVMPGKDGGTPVSVAFPGVERNSITRDEAGGEFKGKEKESALAIQTILKRD